MDSAVAAALLKEEGFEVTGVFMKNWSGDSFGIQAECPWEEDQKAAEAVADYLGIEFRSYNFEKEYREQVLDYFFSEFKKGRTPNPDVMCNTKIKFDVFLKRALADGADMIATGHYVQKKEGKSGYELHMGVDPVKNQAYFLYTLNQDQLSKSLFPIGHLQKAEVRKLAEKYNLPNADRKDSQGICFIGEIDVQDFLRAHISTKVGDIIDVDNNEIVGKHDGVYFYTIGQRKGLDIGGLPKPYYVVDKDSDKNILYVALGNYHDALFRTDVQLENLHLVNDEELKEGQEVQAVIRYQQKPQPALIYPSELKVVFAERQRAVTSGQSLVMYDGTRCLGGGIVL